MKEKCQVITSLLIFLLVLAVIVIVCQHTRYGSIKTCSNIVNHSTSNK